MEVAIYAHSFLFWQECQSGASSELQDLEEKSFISEEQASTSLKKPSLQKYIMRSLHSTYSWAERKTFWA